MKCKDSLIWKWPYRYSKSGIMDAQSESSPSSSKESPPGVEKLTVETEKVEDVVLEQEDKTFSLKSISVIASAVGVPNLNPEAAQHLADDLFYKIKELIYMSRIVMYRNKCDTLTTDDIQKALNIHNHCSILGYESKEDLNFIHVPKADVYCEEDSEIELGENTLTEEEYSNRDDPYIQGTWLMSEEYSEEATLSQPSSYYLQIAKTIMTGSPAHLKVALSDLRTNPKIGPVCPYLLNLVALTVKKVPRDIHLTNALIGTVHAIAHNKYVDPSPYLAINRAANSLLKIVIEINVEKDYGDLAVRVRAGLLLAKVVIIWSIELKQQIDIIRHLLQHLLDPVLPLQSHYGAIVALTALGQRTLDFYLWPVMERYLGLLENRPGSSSDVMVQHVMVAILVAARSSYRKEQISAEQLGKLSKVDQMLYTSFGDTVTPFRMVCNGHPIYPCVKREPNMSKLRLRIKRVSQPLHHQLQQLYRQTNNRIDVKSVFKVSFKKDRTKLPPALYYDSNKAVTSRNKLAYPYTSRNYKFCSKLYKNSAVGDLLMFL